MSLYLNCLQSLQRAYLLQEIQISEVVNQIDSVIINHNTIQKYIKEFKSKAKCGRDIYSSFSTYAVFYSQFFQQIIFSLVYSDFLFSNHKSSCPLQIQKELDKTLRPFNLYQVQYILKYCLKMDKGDQNYKQKQVIEIPTKKIRQGRWSQAERYLFQSLINAYGKNWKIIHSKMPNRSLCQIRSHAQKYFNKMGRKKLEEFERRANILKALQTIEKAKDQQPEIFHPTKQEAQSHPVKIQQVAKDNQNSASLGLNFTNHHQAFKEKKLQKQKINFQTLQNPILNPPLVYMQTSMPYIFQLPTFYRYPYIIHPQQIQHPNMGRITKMQDQQMSKIKKEPE